MVEFKKFTVFYKMQNYCSSTVIEAVSESDAASKVIERFNAVCVTGVVAGVL